MRGVGRAASDPEDEEPTLAASDVRERFGQRVDGGRIDRAHDLADLAQVDRGK